MTAARLPVRSSLPASISESDFQKLVVDFARLRRWRVHHARPARMQSGQWATAIQGHKGLPDLVLARNGVVLFAELKTEKGRVSPDQVEWLAALNGPTGSIAVVWRPRDWDAIVRQLA